MLIILIPPSPPQTQTLRRHHFSNSSLLFFFFLMIRRPPRSTLFLHDALPISATSPNNVRSGRTGGNGNTPAPRVKPTLTRDTPSRAALIGRGAWPPPHVLERAIEPLLLRR